MAKNPKNPKKTEDPNVIDEKAQREFEELRARLRAETEADMVVLRALLDAERQARGLGAGAEGLRRRRRVARIRGGQGDRRPAARGDARGRGKRRPPRRPRRPTRRSPPYTPTPAKRCEEIKARFEARRAGYADKVFGLVTGAGDE